jgi:hypothetical protein
MTTSTHRRNSPVAPRNILLDKLIPATRLCPKKITDRKAATS